MATPNVAQILEEFNKGNSSAQSAQARGYQDAMKAIANKPAPKTFRQYATEDASALIQGILNLPRLGFQAVTNPASIPDIAVNAGGGIVNEYKDLITNPAQHAYEKPFSTILDIIPFIKPAKALASAGKAGKAAEAANVSSKTAKAASVGENVSTVGRGSNKVAEFLNPASKKMLAKQAYSDNVIDIGNVENRYGITGQATTAGKAKAYTQGKIISGSELGKILKKSNFTIDNAKLGDLLEEKLLANSSFEELKDIKRVVSGIKRGGQFDIKKGSQTFDPLRLNKIKEDLYEYGPKASVARGVGEKAAAVIRDLIDDNVEGSRPFLNDYQVLAEGFNALPETSGPLARGGGVFDLLRQATSGAIGKTTQAVYNVAGDSVPGVPGGGLVKGAATKALKIPNSRYNQLFRNYPQAALPSIAAGGGTQQEEDQVDLTALLSQLDGGTDTAQAEENPYPIEAYVEDLQRDRKNADVYKKIFDAYQDKFAEQKIPVSIQNQLIAGESALTIVDEIEKQYAKLNQSDFGPLASILGLGKELGARTQTDELAKSYKASIQSASRRLIKAMGETGQLSAQDVEAAKQLIPGLGDSTDTARNKLDSLRAIIGSNISTIKNKYGDSQASQSGDYSALLQQLLGGQ